MNIPSNTLSMKRSLSSIAPGRPVTGRPGIILAAVAAALLLAGCAGSIPQGTSGKSTVDSIFYDSETEFEATQPPAPEPPPEPASIPAANTEVMASIAACKRLAVNGDWCPCYLGVPKKFLSLDSDYRERCAGPKNLAPFPAPDELPPPEPSPPRAGGDPLRDHLIRREGCEPEPYVGPNGACHVGCGLRIPDAACRAWAEREAAMGATLDWSVERAEADARAALGDFAWGRLNEARRRALTAMAYQVGRGGLRTFRRALGALRMGDWDAAADEMLDSDWGRSASTPPSRARFVAGVVRSGVWDDAADLQ